jgi:hypothetical protein
MNENTTTTHPDRMDLDLLAVGDLAGADKDQVDEHLGDCAPCRERLWRIRQDLAMARRAIPDRAPVEAFRERRASERARRGPWIVAVAGWAAAACAVLAWAPWSSVSVEVEDVVSAGVRTRGAFAVTVLRGRGESVDRLGAVAVCRAGDRLQFEPDLPPQGYLQIVNVQDDGAVQTYLPPTPADRAREELTFSVELDEYAGRERIFFVYSDEPIAPEILTRGAADTLTLRPIEEIERVPLPRGVEAEQRSLLIYKEGTP